MPRRKACNADRQTVTIPIANVKGSEKMSVEEYIAQSRSEGKVITNEYINGVDYTLITELDGWVTVIERNISGYSVLLQACNRQKAIEYIVRREPIPVPVNII